MSDHIRPVLYTGTTSAKMKGMVSEALKSTDCEGRLMPCAMTTNTYFNCGKYIKEKLQGDKKHLTRKLDLLLEGRIFQAQRITSEKTLRWESGKPKEYVVRTKRGDRENRKGWGYRAGKEQDPVGLAGYMKDLELYAENKEKHSNIVRRAMTKLDYPWGWFLLWISIGMRFFSTN